MRSAKAMRNARRNEGVLSRRSVAVAAADARVACTSNEVNSRSVSARSTGKPIIVQNPAFGIQMLRTPLTEPMAERKLAFSWA